MRFVIRDITDHKVSWLSPEEVRAKFKDDTRAWKLSMKPVAKEVRGDIAIVDAIVYTTDRPRVQPGDAYELSIEAAGGVALDRSA